MNNITTGILAHVDAGKTTLIESMLFLSHAIRKQGRVDHQDTLLDYDEQERARGITIYAKQAAFTWKDHHIDVIDTPGHVDFSSEMERSLKVLDQAILLISALDGVQSHTRTIWKCLNHYHKPAILFVNKMDAAHKSKEELLEQIRKELSSSVIDMEDEEHLDSLAMVNEEMMNAYLETGTIPASMIQKAFENREFFPLWFGSALKNQGITQLMDGMVDLAKENTYPQAFGAKVFKVSRDESGKPLAWMKITGGQLSIRDDLLPEEKAEQIRIYNGLRYNLESTLEAGRIAAVRGLSAPFPGMGLGFEEDEKEAMLTPALSYDLILPSDADPVVVYGKCKILAMENPNMEFSYQEERKKISVMLMGDIQMEILQQRILSLAGIQVGFAPGQVVFLETIDEPVFGYGHFEPLRHYAEVHLLLEPLERGKGLEFKTACSRDLLAINWQNLVLTHLQEKRHRGVLYGAGITDMRITLIAGKAHNKHTEGGDFRQATYRAVRQGLKSAKSRLLEPYYAFSLVIDQQQVSRALFDLESRNCQVSVETLEDGMVQIEGRGPVRKLMNYQSEVLSYTRGNGRFSYRVDGYDNAVDEMELLEERGYDSELDRFNPTGSVFCTHGSGYYVPWDEVEEHLHIPVWQERSTTSISYNSSHISENQMKEFFEKAGGQNRNQKKEKEKRVRKPRKDLNMDPASVQKAHILPPCLIVDGYNMIYGWDSLKHLAKESLQAAREELISTLINYQGYKNCSLIIVFDGHRSADHPASQSHRGSASIVYTSSSQSADAWIERKVRDLKGKFALTVATSDGLIQNSILGAGARRISARELELQIESARKSIQDWITKS